MSGATEARDRRWAERRANRLNARRLKELPLFADTHALETVAPTVTTDQMVEWEHRRVEATNQFKAEQIKYWEDRYWGLLADAHDYITEEYEWQIINYWFERNYQLDPASPGYTGKLAYRCDTLNNLLCAIGAPGFYEHRSEETRAYCQRRRADSINTFFFIHAVPANRENGHGGPSFGSVTKRANKAE
jgi:hypothetical protein